MSVAAAAAPALASGLALPGVLVQGILGSASGSLVGFAPGLVALDRVFAALIVAVALFMLAQSLGIAA